MSSDMTPNGLLTIAHARFRELKDYIEKREKSFAEQELDAFKNIWHPVQRSLEYMRDEFESISIHKDLLLSTMSEKFPFEDYYETGIYFRKSREIDERVVVILSDVRFDDFTSKRVERSLLQYTNARVQHEIAIRDLQRLYSTYSAHLRKANATFREVSKHNAVVDKLVTLLFDLDKELKP